MVRLRLLDHFTEAFRWSGDEKINIAEALAAAMGMAVPVLWAVLAGRITTGFAAALGALIIGRIEPGSSVSEHVARTIEAVLPVMLAAFVAVGINGQDWPTEPGLVLLASIAAAFGGFSRPMAAASTRFILFLIIVGATQIPHGEARSGFLALIIGGASWTSTLRLALGAVAYRFANHLRVEPVPHHTTFRQKYDRWKRLLRTWNGWNYTIRLGVGLIGAAIFERLWSGHHFHWVGLTVALLTMRTGKTTVPKTTQRVLGTIIGVCAAWLALQSGLPNWGLVVATGVLAGARSLLRDRHYLAYTAVMTLLVMLVIDAGQPPDPAILIDRLVATCIGGTLVIAVATGLSAICCQFR